MKKFEVIFYEDDRGNCPIAVWLRSLDRENSKGSRSMMRKIYFQIERLENEGLNIEEPIIKRLNPTIWELRPIPNRIFSQPYRATAFFFYTLFVKEVDRHRYKRSQKQKENIRIGYEVKYSEMV